MLVLLAGAGLGSAFWEPVLALAPGAHVVVDRQGRLGTHCPGPPALHAQAAVLARLMEDLAVADGAPTVLVAHSMAAFEAELLARRRPDLVDGIVLVDPSLALRPALTPPLAAGAVGGRAPLAALALTVVRGLLGAPAVHRAVSAVVRAGMRGQVSQPRALGSPAWADTWTAASLTGGAAESLAYSAQQDDLLRARERDRLPVWVPTLLLQAPPYASRRRLAAAHRAFSRLVVRRVPGSGHLMAVDAPQEVARAVREVLGMVGG
nr:MULTISPECIES: alpha/beta hydrolase [unclassified Actinomyces]